MKVTQVAELANTLTQSALGESAVVNADLTNVQDIGTELDKLTQGELKHPLRNLLDKVGRTIYVDRKYDGDHPDIMMESWEYGALLEKISAKKMPEAKENPSWALENGKSYDPNVFNGQEIESKVYGKYTTLEVDDSVIERQLKGAFKSADSLNAYLSMLQTNIRNSLTIKTSSLARSLVNGCMADAITAGGLQAINLLVEYNSIFNKTLSASACIYDHDFIRYACFRIKEVASWLTTASTLFNSGKRERFTPSSMLNIEMLGKFKALADIYLQSDTFHNEFQKLPSAHEVAYWQGSGTDFSFDSISSIDVKSGSGNTVKQSGIIATMFDKYAMGINNYNERVTTNFNPVGEFYNYYYKVDAGYASDFNENMVVFFVEDAT